MTFSDPYRTIIVEPVELPATEPEEAPAEPEPVKEPAPAETPERDPVPA